MRDPGSNGAASATAKRRAAIACWIEAILDRYADPALRFQEINKLYSAYSEIYPPETFPPLLEKKSLELGLAAFPGREDLRARLDQVEEALEAQFPLYAYRSRAVGIDDRVVALDGIEADIEAIDDPARRCTHVIAAFLKYLQAGRPGRCPAALQALALSYLAGAAAGRQAALKHFVVTRLGLGVHHQPWYDSTLTLFEAITVPSMRAQSGQQFIWLIVIDRQIPQAPLRRLTRIVAGIPNLHIVPLDLTGMAHVRHGSFDHVWDCCQEYILAHRLLTDPMEYVITSLVDADDALHRDALSLARAHLDPEVKRLRCAERDRSAVVRHTGGVVLTFPRGLRWFAEADIVQPLEYEFLGMGIFVLARFSSGRSVLSSRHSAWPAMAEVLAFDVIKAQSERPMWVYVRHDRSQVDWEVEAAATDPASADILRADFTIDFDALAQWRGDPALRRPDTRRDRHSGLSGREQHDCCFRLGALNRQIAALERKRRQSGTDDEDELLLLRQQPGKPRFNAPGARRGRQVGPDRCAIPRSRGRSRRRSHPEAWPGPVRRQRPLRSAAGSN
jgi:Putative rhamnosyl transferase